MKSSQKVGFLVDPWKHEFPWLPLSEVARFFKKRGFQIVGYGFDHITHQKKFKKLFDSCHNMERDKENFDFNAAVSFSKKVKKERIRILFFANHNYTSLLVTTKYLTKGRLRLIYLQDRPFREINQDRYHSLRSNQLDAWVTPNSQTLQEVRAGANIEFGKLHIIGRPLRVSSQIVVSNQRIRAREKLGIDENATAIGFFMNQSAELNRDFIELLRAVLEEPALRSRVVFLIAGNGDSKTREILKQGVLQIASNVGLSESLFYFVKRKMVFAQDGADVIFLLSGEEPFSGAAALAKLHGLPCIGFKSGMLSEVLRDYPFQSLNGFEEKSELGFELELLKKMRFYGKMKPEDDYSKRKRKDYLSGLLALAEALPKNRKTLY